MKPLSVFYDQEVAVWLRSNPGRVVTQFQVAKLYDSAFVRAATMITAINGLSIHMCLVNTTTHHLKPQTDRFPLHQTRLHSPKLPILSSTNQLHHMTPKKQKKAKLYT
ncbi:hypothetical protein ANN_27811 [Periplaneta americana]|uniref:Uncharacterized protein n=1 Tax=Periplaneta americana TaxID=6978 RepID=A0ABQ8RVE0_PERAM|nr:hypothetical protein ANN_27811 [Periplaneta americana]